jgi:Na+-driven multidrug efflux pump
VGTVKKDIFIGFIISLFATAAGVFLYLEYFSRYSFDETLKMIGEGDLYGKVLSLAAIPNLFVFFIFIKKKQDNRAKGVLIATILTALTTLIIKFF